MSVRNIFLIVGLLLTSGSHLSAQTNSTLQLQANERIIKTYTRGDQIQLHTQQQKGDTLISIYIDGYIDSLDANGIYLEYYTLNYAYFLSETMLSVYRYISYAEEGATYYLKLDDICFVDKRSRVKQTGQIMMAIGFSGVALTPAIAIDYGSLKLNRNRFRTTLYSAMGTGVTGAILSLISRHKTYKIKSCETCELCLDGQKVIPGKLIVK